ncbi:hypothetical protein PF005_g31190 [Phytophthora fragariae]|uniref:Uncharacterized protein n=1 Tax=Phytophthora fragariae TaxID=53985 RepID=A0A6A3VIJ9_9STRA
MFNQNDAEQLVARQQTCSHRLRTIEKNSIVLGDFYVAINGFQSHRVGY